MEWGLLGDLLDIATDIAKLPFEIAKAGAELAQESKEAIIQDVKNKVNREPDKPIRTSYMVKEEADKIIAASKDNYWEAKRKFSVQWDRMAKKSEELSQARAGVYFLLGQAAHSNQFPQLPAATTIAVRQPEIPALDTFQFDMGTYLGSTSMRMEAAEEYLSLAKDYRVAVKSTIAQVDQMQQLVMKAASFQTEELEMLSSIRVSYQKQQNSVLLESAKLLHDLALLCTEEVTQQTNTSYEHLLQKLKTLWQ